VFSAVLYADLFSVMSVISGGQLNRTGTPDTPTPFDVYPVILPCCQSPEVNLRGVLL